jgi:hypothetical protein
MLKRKRGRPIGTGHPCKNHREQCRICNKKLDGLDPKRNTKHGKRYTGECRFCAAKRILILLWKKRGPVAIKKRVYNLSNELNILKSLLKDA